MNLEKIIKNELAQRGQKPYGFYDRFFIPMDKKQIRRTRNLRLIPREKYRRRGGKYSYGEWAHVIGIFQSLFYHYLVKHESNRILDIGSGTGILGIASEPFISSGGKYTGVEIRKQDVEFCKKHYAEDHFEHIHFDAENAYYNNPEQKDNTKKWPVDDVTFDLVTALSVWTHLNEEDSLRYFKEISRVLKPDGKAIITFFLLDDDYKNSLSKRHTTASGRFHSLKQDRWIFDQSSYGSKMWFHPEWVKVPEHVIALTKEGLDYLMSNSGLKLVKHYPGNWKEIPGLYFQDVLVFEKQKKSK